MQTDPSQSSSPEQPHAPHLHSPEQNEISAESLIEIARDLAESLAAIECCGVTQADVLRHIDSETLTQRSDLHPRRLSRAIPQYAADFEAHFKDNSTATNIVGRFFEKRKMFKEFVSHREEFLRDTVKTLEDNHLLKRNVQIAVATGHWGVGPVATAVEFIGSTRLGKEVLRQLEDSGKRH